MFQLNTAFLSGNYYCNDKIFVIEAHDNNILC